MHKKSSGKKPRYSKAVREWVAELIREEVRQGTPEKEARKIAKEVIHTLIIDTEIKK